jgi:hypothetical protein
MNVGASVLRGRLRSARARLDAAIAAHELARLEDNRLKTPVTKEARETATRELQLAARLVSELMTRECGL